jgi:hypothetical protein
VQRRLDENPEKMRQRRETVEHPFGTIGAGWEPPIMKALPRVASEMALHVLAYNLTRVMNIMGIQPHRSHEGIVQNRNVTAHRQLTDVASGKAFLHMG